MRPCRSPRPQVAPFLRLFGLCLGLAGGALRAQAQAAGGLVLSATLPDYRLECLPRIKAPGQRPLVLALGGGAAKGIAHAGVLQRLQEEGLPVEAIAGTSIGAFMGSMYATGYSGFSIQQLLEKVDIGAILLDRQHRFPGETLWEQESERTTFLSLDFRPGEGLSFSPGTSSGLDLKRALQILLSRASLEGSERFDALRVPFRAVCTNLQTGRAAAPAQGDLATVVRASMSIPGMFTPVLLGNEQHVDGMLVQNLPVEAARALCPGAAVMAVEVGQLLESERQNSIFSIAFRSLDVSIEERTEISRRAADLHLRPRTAGIPYLEFHQAVALAVQEGRKAFDPALPALEDLLYGPGCAEAAPGGSPTFLAPAELQAPLRDLAAATLPPGPRQRRHYLRLIRRALAAGLGSRAEVRFGEEGPQVLLEPYPRLQRIAFQVPPAWEPLARSVLRDAGVEEGRPYNPAALGKALDAFFLQATLRGRPLLRVQGTRFEPGTGELRLCIREELLDRFRVTPGILSEGQTAYLVNLLAPFEGRPFEAFPFTQTVLQAEKRLGLEELRLEADSGGEGSLRATPVPDSRVTLDVALGYESTWLTHGAVSVRTNRLLGTDFGLGLDGSANRLNKSGEFHLTRSLSRWPHLGLELSAYHFEHHFLSEALQSPLSGPAPSADLLGRALEERSLGLGLFARFGLEDRGLAVLEGNRAWSTLHPGLEAQPMPRMEQLQLRAEWDSFDRYLFPTQGLLVRARFGQGLAEEPQGGSHAYRLAYLRMRQLWPLGRWGSVEGDLESGLGWRLPMARWYSVGGPGFMAGTASAGFLTPNFAVFRLGLPLHVTRVFGVNVQVVPRADAGYLGARTPGELRNGPLVKGLGVELRAELGRWYCEVSAGRWFRSDAGSLSQSRVNILFGAHPFDLWRRR